jgi:hypothetical protein
MHELRERLGDLAGEASALARNPGPGAILLRARARRRRRAGGAALLVVALAGAVWVAGGRVAGPDQGGTTPAAGERNGSVRRQGPATTTTVPAPATTAARPRPGPDRPIPLTAPAAPPVPAVPTVVVSGTSSGLRWLLRVSPAPGLGGSTRCLQLEWPALPASALRCEPVAGLTTGPVGLPPGQAGQAVIGAAPAGADHVRVSLAGRAPVTTAALAVAGVRGRWYVAFVPTPAPVSGAAALAGGRVVAATTDVQPAVVAVGGPVPPPGGDLPEPPPPPVPPASGPLPVSPPLP